MTAHQPVFIVGSYRSGTSVLTWSLGQHSNIYPLPETHWISRLAIDMQMLYEYGTSQGEYTHLGALDWGEDDFYRHFGSAVDQFVLDTKEHRLNFIRKVSREKWLLKNKAVVPAKRAGAGKKAGGRFQVTRSEADAKLRWVDGTPENSMHMYALSRMFPKAKFIHILRDPDLVAKSLMNFSNAGEGQGDFSEKSAYMEWMRLVTAAEMGERALGADKVLRIHQEELAADAEQTIRRCLLFLGEGFESACLEPLEVKVNSSKVEQMAVAGVPDQGSRYGVKAREFYQKLCDEYHPSSEPDPEALNALEKSFSRYVQRVNMFKRFADRFVGVEQWLRGIFSR